MKQKIRNKMWRIGRRLYMDARREPGRNLPASSGEVFIQRTVLEAWDKASDLVVLDVGANRGQWSHQFLSLAAQQPTGAGQIRLHAFEPTPQSREAYKARIDPLPNKACATLHALALSDTSGQAQFAIWEDTAGTNTLLFNEASQTRAKAIIDVELSTLPAFAEAQGLSRIHLLKIDTEGNDAKVIEGARDLVAQGAIDVIQFEYNHRWIEARRYLKDVFDLAAGTEYVVAKILPDRLEIIAGWHPELERFFEANYVMVHTSVLDRFTRETVRVGPGNVYHSVVS